MSPLHEINFSDIYILLQLRKSNLPNNEAYEYTNFLSKKWKKDSEVKKK